MLFYIFLLFSLKTTLAVNNNIYIENGTENGPYSYAIESIASCIVQAALKDLFYKSTIFIYNPDEDTTTNPEKEFRDQLIDKLSVNYVPIITTDDINTINDEVISTLCVVITEDCRVFYSLSFERDLTKYLFIIIGDFMACNETFQNNSEILMSKDITFTVLDDSRNFTFMYAKLEMDEITCNLTRSVRFYEVNRCARGSLRNGESIFPTKGLRDFKKCPLNSAFATLYPYMMLRNKVKKLINFQPVTELNIYGADVEIMKIASQYFNTTLYLQYFFRQEENPYLNQEYIDLLKNGSLDVCAGGLYRLENNAVEFSGVYSRQSIIWAYSVEREIRSWQSFVGKVNGIYVFFIFYIIYAMVWRLICKFDNQAVSIHDTLLYSAGALLGATSLQDARTLKQKIVNIMYLILALHLSTYIAIQLYSYLTIQGPPPLYKTIDALISSGIKPYLRDQAKYFLEDTKYVAFANTSGSCNNFMECEEVILKNGGATILIDGYIPLLQADTAVGDEAKVVKVNEEILFIYHEMIIRKTSYITVLFQNMILHLYDSGICQKLYDDAIGITYIDKANIANKNIMSNSYSCQMGCAITLVQAAGAFYIWIFGCAISSIVFILEIIMRKERIQFVE